MPQAQPHIFISYARKDRKHAWAVKKFLEDAGFSTWIDQRDLNPAQDFSGEIETAIQQASHVVVCVSPDVGRPDSFVRREVAYALNEDEHRRARLMPGRLPIIPLLFPGGRMPVLLATWTYVDAQQAVRLPAALAETVARIRGLDRPVDAPTYADPPEVVAYLNALHHQASMELQRSVLVLLDPPVREVLHRVPHAFRLRVSPVVAAAQEQPPVKLRSPTWEPGTVFESLAAAFQACNTRVVLLGESGVGKTTALLTLLRDAAVARLHDAGCPLPVLVAAYSWDGQTAPCRWARDDGIRSRAVRELANSRFLYLVDGLDEITLSSDSRGADLAQADRTRADSLARFLREPRADLAATDQIVVACRTTSYQQALHEREGPFAVIELEKLDKVQVTRFLRERTPARLLNEINQDPDLAELARVPLYLTLLTLAFEERDIHQPDTKATIWHQFVQRRFYHEAVRQGGLPYTEQVARKHLTSIAAAMQEGNVPRPLLPREKVRTLLGDDGNPFLDFALGMGFLRSDGETIHFAHLELQVFFTIPPLVHQLTEGSEADRWTAGQLLARLGESALAELMAALVHADPLVRQIAATALGEIGQGAATAALRDRAHTEEVTAVRIALLRAMVPISATIAQGVAIRWLHDQELKVRGEAAQVLDYLGPANGVSALLQVLQRGDFPSVLDPVIGALGKSRDARIVPTLIQLLRRGSWFPFWRLPPHHLLLVAFYKPMSWLLPDWLVEPLPNSDTAVRASAAKALGRIGGDTAVAALTTALADRQGYGPQ